MTERWLPCVGFEGLYSISDLGRVYSEPRERTKGGILKAWLDRDGYPTVCLAGQFISVHRLVALAFHGDKWNQLHRQVAHLDGSRDNCRADNLRWVSHRENQSHKAVHGTTQTGERNPFSKLTVRQAQEIKLRSLTGEGPKALAAEYGVHPSTVKAIKTGRTWKDCQARACKASPRKDRNDQHSP